MIGQCPFAGTPTHCDPKAGAEMHRPPLLTLDAVLVFMRPIKARATRAHNYRAMGVGSEKFRGLSTIEKALRGRLLLVIVFSIMRSHSHSPSVRPRRVLDQ